MHTLKFIVLSASIGLVCLTAGQALHKAEAAPRQDAPKGTLKESPKNNATWEAKGTLFEACSCSVPCPCNFGQSPTQGFCHTIYAYRLKTARYGNMVLDGLVFGGGEGPQGAAGFVDARATATQRPILEKMALAVFGKGGASGGPRKFTPARLALDDTGNQFHVEFGAAGGFAADVLIGADGKNPIIVENNTTWPVRRFIKGKTTRFDYKDALGNNLHYDGVNANLGEFTLAGSLGSGGSAAKGTGSCCAGK